MGNACSSGDKRTQDNRGASRAVKLVDDDATKSANRRLFESALPQDEAARARYDLLVRILLLGDSGVGKSAIMRRYVDDDFESGAAHTIGLDFKTKDVVMDEKKVKIQIWDTAGQERFRVISKSHFRGAHAFLLVFDITDRPSFAQVQSFLDSIQAHGVPAAAKLVLLVGNKSDLRHVRAVSVDEATRYAANAGCVGYLETSAKLGDNVSGAIDRVLEPFLAQMAKRFDDA